MTPQERLFDRVAERIYIDEVHFDRDPWDTLTDDQQADYRTTASTIMAQVEFYLREHFEPLKAKLPDHVARKAGLTKKRNARLLRPILGSLLPDEADQSSSQETIRDSNQGRP